MLEALGNVFGDINRQRLGRADNRQQMNILIVASPGADTNNFPQPESFALGVRFNPTPIPCWLRISTHSQSSSYFSKEESARAFRAT
jgi:hypothetical protein